MTFFTKINLCIKKAHHNQSQYTKGKMKLKGYKKVYLNAYQHCYTDLIYIQTQLHLCQLWAFMRKSTFTIIEFITLEIFTESYIISIPNIYKEEMKKIKGCLKCKALWDWIACGV